MALIGLSLGVFWLALETRLSDAETAALISGDPAEHAVVGTKANAAG